MAFLVPILEILLKREEAWKKLEIGAIVIVPTRELAYQINEVLAVFLSETELQKFRSKLLVGGSNIDEDIKDLIKNGGHILVCTPGRLQDLLERKSELNLSSRVKSLEILVLDEADLLLDLGFESSLNTILSYLPRQRRTGLFSATQTQEVLDLMRAGLRNPVVITVKEKQTQSTPKLLQNFFMIVKPEEKLVQLLQFFKKNELQKSLIFLPTCACVEFWGYVMPYLLQDTMIFSLHGKMKNKRSKVLDKFKNAKNALLLCTDVMARGVDIPEIDWVLQWEPPSSAASFVHRVGRTARQGNNGNSLILLLPTEEAYVNFLSKNQKVTLTKMNEYSIDSKKLSSINKIIYDLQLKDRNIFDKATRAFVSHIRAYSKHECNLLLSVNDLDLGKIATSYGLLRLPKMPEMKEEFKSSFVSPYKDYNVNEITYTNKQKQSSYLKKIKIFNTTGKWPDKKQYKKQSESWELSKTKKEERKMLKKRRKTAKLRKIDKITIGQLKKKRKQKFTVEEINELKQDILNIKKFKKKKISETELNNELGVSETSDINE